LSKAHFPLYFRECIREEPMANGILYCRKTGKHVIVKNEFRSEKLSKRSEKNY
jgi:hypothetical protein